MKVLKSDLVSWAAILASVGGSAALYSRLPERMAVHFAVDGTPNGWMSRALAAIFLPALMLVMWAVTRFAYRLSFHRTEHPAPVATMASITSVLLAAVHGYLLAYSLDVLHGDAGLRALFVVTSIALVAFGLVAPRVQRNPVVGVRTFWTLVSEENWSRTARTGGASLVVSGVLAAAFAVTLPKPVWIYAWIATVVVGSLVPIAYSIKVARQLATENQD